MCGRFGVTGASSASGVSRYRPESYAPFDEFRAGEYRAGADGHRPFSRGNLRIREALDQMLMGIAWLERVRMSTEFGERIVIWPFETGIGETSRRVNQVMCSLKCGRACLRSIVNVMTSSICSGHDGRSTYGSSRSGWLDSRGQTRGCLHVSVRSYSEEGWTLGVH